MINQIQHYKNCDECQVDLSRCKDLTDKQRHIIRLKLAKHDWDNCKIPECTWCYAQ